MTRLTGYTVETALDLIERANQSLGEQGTFVLDLATNRNESGYKFWNDDLYVANTTLGAMGLPVLFDEETEFGDKRLERDGLCFVGQQRRQLEPKLPAKQRV